MISHEALIVKLRVCLLEQQPLSSESFCCLSLWEKGLGEGIDVKPNETSANY